MSDKPATLRAAPLLGGVALLVIYMRIGSLFGFQASYGPPLPPLHKDVPTPFAYVATSEYRFWLAHLALAVPGALLVAWGLAPRLVPLVRRWLAKLDSASPRAWQMAAVAFGGVLFVWSLAGHYLVLLDTPLTDDEYAVTLGARILASGHVSVPMWQPAGAFFDLFTFQREGTITSMDFPGVLMFGALAILTKLGPALYAIASAVSGVAVAYAAGRWFGPRGRVVAALIWLASPMIVALSITSHAHVPSRMFVALAIAFVARLDSAEGDKARRDLILIGVFAGLGFLTRPFETFCLLGPLGGYLAWTRRAKAAWLAAGLAPAIVVFALYNQATTGVWYLQARFAPGVVGGTASLESTMWDRLGTNLGWNALMIAVFFLGIPAIAAVIAGIERKRPMLLAVALGGVAAFVMCLLHDNTGIHSVGPIHLSELAVPLVLLATAGTMRTFAWLGNKRLDRGVPAVLMASYLTLACAMFNLSNLASLRTQAHTQTLPMQTLEALDVHHAIVMTRSFIVLPQINKEIMPHGTWVLDFPIPRPDLSDDILFVKPNANPDALQAAHPDRAIYKMTFHAEAPAIRLELLREPKPR